MKFEQIGVILLAAGQSARLGKPKQLLHFQGESLLRRSVRAALAVSGQVVAVLGAKPEIIRAEIEDLPVSIAENSGWEKGMSGSIKCGLEKLLAAENKVEAVIVTVCDQPFADEILLSKIIAAFRETGCLIAACEYADTLGVPALFHKNIFPEILALEAAAGAKRLMSKHPGQTVAVSFPEGAIDIDTPNDYENLIRKFT